MDPQALIAAASAADIPEDERKRAFDDLVESARREYAAEDREHSEWFRGWLNSTFATDIDNGR